MSFGIDIWSPGRRPIDWDTSLCYMDINIHRQRWGRCRSYPNVRRQKTSLKTLSHLGMLNCSPTALEGPFGNQDKADHCNRYIWVWTKNPKHLASCVPFECGRKRWARLVIRSRANKWHWWSRFNCRTYRSPDSSDPTRTDAHWNRWMLTKIRGTTMEVPLGKPSFARGCRVRVDRSWSFWVSRQVDVSNRSHLHEQWRVGKDSARKRSILDGAHRNDPDIRIAVEHQKQMFSRCIVHRHNGTGLHRIRSIAAASIRLRQQHHSNNPHDHHRFPSNRDMTKKNHGRNADECNRSEFDRPPRSDNNHRSFRTALH